MGWLKEKIENLLDKMAPPIDGDPQEPAMPTMPQEEPAAGGMNGYGVVPPQAAAVTDHMNGQGTVPPQITDVDESVQELPGFTRGYVMPENVQNAEHTGTSAVKAPFEFWPDDRKNDNVGDKEAPYSYERDRGTVYRELDNIQPSVPISLPKNTAVISLILDTTMSMKRIYARLYSKMMKELSAIRSLHDVSLLWRLSFISHDGYQFVGEMTTRELEDRLGNIVLRGGSTDGYEEILEPLRRECMALTDVEADVKGLLMLTDTYGKQPDAQKEKQEKTFSLDFCILYLYKDGQNFDDYITINKTDTYHIRTLLCENNLPRLKEKVLQALQYNNKG